MIEVVLKSACGIKQNGINKLHLCGEVLTLNDDEAMNLISAGVAERTITQPESVVSVVEVKDDREAETVIPEKDITDMNVSELKKYAKSHGIDIGNAKAKSDILIAIESYTMSREDDIVL